MSDRFVDLLRHGEVSGGQRFLGETDAALSPLGWAQMRAIVTSEARWDALFASPASRCLEFARELAQQRGLPLRVMSELGERRFGAWENRPAAEIPLAELKRFWRDPVGYTPPGAESFEALRQRVLAGWMQVLREGPSCPLVLTHGGVVRIILGEALGIPAEVLIRIEVPPACRSRLRIPPDEGRASLMFHGKLEPCGDIC